MELSKKESKKSKRLLKKARKESRDNTERNRIMATIGLALISIGAVAAYAIMNEEITIPYKKPNVGEKM